MTNPTPHGRVPEALRLADEISKAGAFPAYPRAPYEAAAAELRRQHTRIAELEAQLESIRAGGVNSPLMGQPQAMPDLTALTERGAKAWTAVDAQALREGRWYMVTHDGVATLCEDRRDAEKEAKDADMAWPHSGPHRAVQLVEASTAGFTAADMATVEARGFRDGVASLAANAESEPVAQLAAERDELFQAAIDFIRTLTGMEPPPIEVAPPEVFAPFHAFVNTVQAIINKRNSSPREGMVMVPKEPTHHMLNAAASAYKDARQSLGAYNAPWAAYRAMLEVAAPPTTPAGSGKGE